MPGRPGIINRQALVDDCAITAMNVFVQERRSAAMVDVGVRVKAVKGGVCRILPMSVQVATTKGANAGRPMSLRFIDGQVQRPVSMAEGAGGEMLGPWAGVLRPNEEKQIVLRYYVEGLEGTDGAIDPVGRVAIRMREFGPRVYSGAPLNVKVSLESGAKAAAKLSTGNPKTPVAERPTGADGSASFSATLSKDDLAPVLEWRYDATPPAAEADKLTNGLSVLEYLRSGLVTDLAAGAPAPVKDEKKDEKKDDKKKDDPAAAAWDRAFDVALAAARSSDPVVAGMGQRTLAWLASGLSPAVVRVQAPGAPATPESVVVPEKIASLVSRAADGFTAATGQRVPPSPGNSPLARTALARLGEPGSRKKDADDAIKRLVDRIDENKPAPTVGSFFSTAPAIALAPGVKTAGTQLIGWNRQGVAQFIQSTPVAPPRRPLVQRMVHGISHLRGLIKFSLVVVVLGAVITGLWWWITRGRRNAQLAASDVPAPKPATDAQPA